MNRPKDIRSRFRWGLSLIAGLFGLLFLTPLRLNIETWTAANGLDRLWDQEWPLAMGEWLTPVATFFIGAAIALWVDHWLRQREAFYVYYKSLSNPGASRS